VFELKDPDKLIMGCIEFHEIEPRDIVYTVARKMTLGNSEYHIMAGIEVLLLNWNAVYLQKQPDKVRRSLGNEILEAYRSSKNDLDILKNKRLETVDLRDSDIVKRIKDTFRSFSKYRSIETTGASKAIHLINPKLFMMWDSEIRRNYHRLHPFYRIKAETFAECYVEFMKNMQDVARSILQKKSMKRIWKMHLVRSKDPQLVNAFSQAAVETLPKMLDECNYVKFKQDIDL
jgi:hypothetical protein